jgi:hypothetical protein
MSIRKLGAILIAGAMFAVAPPPLLADPPIANVGTLTCVTSPGDQDTLAPERQLSCTFTPISGVKAQMRGTIKRIGAQTRSDAKVVLAWTVMAPELGAPAKQLEGRYVGSIGEGRDANATGLIGGAGGNIALRPLNLEANKGENAALAVLELHLSAMKA